MARVVLIHGIGQQNSSCDAQEKMWLPSVVKGVLRSGHPHAAEVAAELSSSLGADRATVARMAFYGDQYLPPDVQGGEGELDAEFESIMESLALALLQITAARADERSAAEARQALLQTDRNSTGVQGPGAVTRGAMAVLDGNRWLSARIFGLAQRARPDLIQVARYLADSDLKNRIQALVTDLVDDETRLVISHSLGSIVAWEICHELTRPLPTLITLGSPLGLDSMIYPRLRPQPPCWPPSVNRWVNIAHYDDIIAVEPLLATLFPSTDGRQIEDHTTTSEHDHHGAAGYLEEPTTGLAVTDALDPNRTRGVRRG
jgi:hypothetical protein